MSREQKRVLSMPGAMGVNQVPAYSNASRQSVGLPSREAAAASALPGNSATEPRFAPAVLEQYVEAEEGAPFVHMSPRHLKQLAREGKVPAHPRGDGQRRRWLFLLSELDAWMRGRVNSACDPCRA